MTNFISWPIYRGSYQFLRALLSGGCTIWEWIISDIQKVFTSTAMSALTSLLIVTLFWKEWQSIQNTFSDMKVKIWTQLYHRIFSLDRGQGCWSRMTNRASALMTGSPLSQCKLMIGLCDRKVKVALLWYRSFYVSVTAR